MMCSRDYGVKMSRVVSHFRQKMYLPLRLCMTQCDTELKVEEPVEDKSEMSITQKPVNKQIRPTLQPVSMMGLGDPRTALYWRHRLIREFEEKPEEDDYIPSVLTIMYKKSPELVSELYPVASRRLAYIDQLSKEKATPKESGPFQYPFQTKSRDVVVSTSNSSDETSAERTVETLTASFNNLMKHVEESPVKAKQFDPEDNLEDMRQNLWKVNYGTPRPNVPASTVPCGGCGSFLHCQDTAIPGYVPSERFVGLRKKKLAEVICQRCLFLQHFNVALNVTVNSEDYPKILAEIQNKIAVVLLMVDLTDFPCSIWPGIIDVIGPNRPIVVVGNKLDLLPQDEHGFLERVKASLKQNLRQCGVDTGSNVRYLGLISAKTGYGVEDLITKLQDLHRLKGDVYIIGCTNVGKSTLFNALLQSDYCQVQSVDLVQRATTSIWPGTTLQLLKFPILRPTGWRLYERTQRLQREAANRKEQRFKRHLDETKYIPPVISLIGRIGMTFHNEENSNAVPFAKPPEPKKSFLPGDPLLKTAHFCCDTPGAIYKDQILELLTIDELLKTIPKETIIPRTFVLNPERTLFLAGLGRVDFVNGPVHVLVTVFASAHLPVHIIYTEVADVFYQQNLGTDMLGVPTGGPERLKDFPPLEAARTFEMQGLWEEQSSGDIVLSSAGWISVNILRNKSCTLKVYTPGGRGCYLRQPSLLPFAAKMRGKRIKGSPAYEINS